MEKICLNCNKKFKVDKNKDFCPDCVLSFTKEEKYVKSLIESIDYTFGNQAKYAEKLKETFAEYKRQLESYYNSQYLILRKLILNNEDNEAKYLGDHLVNKDTLNDYIYKFAKSTKLDEIDLAFKHFIEKAINISDSFFSDRSIIEKEKESKTKEREINFLIQVELLSNKIIEALFLLEKQSNIFSSFDPTLDINKKNKYESDFKDDLQNKKINSGLVKTVLKEINSAFENVKLIIKYQGIISFTNNNYKNGEINTFSDYISKGKDYETNLRIALKDLKISNNKDYSDLFNEDFESHIVLFFDTMCLFANYLSKPIIVKKESIFKLANNLGSQLNKWYEYIEVAVDIQKCRSDVDMISKFITTKEHSNDNILRLINQNSEVNHEFY